MIIKSLDEIKKIHLSLYENKKVCLLGCGSSLENKNIYFKNYDLVVGTNRIYKTKYLKNLNILYDTAHFDFDPINDKKLELINNSNIKNYFINPSYYCLKFIKNTERIKIPFYICLDRAKGKKILSGLYAYYLIINSCPASLDIFGFDFYTGNYIDGLRQTHSMEEINRYHNLEEEKKGFVLSLKNNINWHK